MSLSSSINWTKQADPSNREPCCAKGDPCLEHNPDTQVCGNCPEIYIPKNPNEDPGYCPECIELICKEEEVKCDECFSTTAEHKSYCSALAEDSD